MSLIDRIWTCQLQIKMEQKNNAILEKIKTDNVAQVSAECGELERLFPRFYSIAMCRNSIQVKALTDKLDALQKKSEGEYKAYLDLISAEVPKHFSFVYLSSKRMIDEPI